MTHLAANVSTIEARDIPDVAEFLARQVPPGEAKTAAPLSPADRLRWLLVENPARADDIPFGWRIRSEAGAVVGAAICTPFRISSGGAVFTALMFSKFYVDPPYRGMGLALLMRFVREGARFPLFCTSTNAVAGALFKRVGATMINGLDHTMLGIRRPKPLIEEWLHRKTHIAPLARALAWPTALAPARIGRGAKALEDVARLSAVKNVDEAAALMSDAPSDITAVVRSRDYLHWRYFSAERDKHVYRFQFKRGSTSPTPGLRYSEDPNRTREKSGSSEYLSPGVVNGAENMKPLLNDEPDRLVIVNEVRAGYRGQIRVLNVLDVWPPTSAASAPALCAQLSLRYENQFDTIWLRSQPPAAEEALAAAGYVRRTFPAPLGWYIDRENRMPAKNWYVMPGESEQEISTMAHKSYKPNMEANLKVPRTDWGDVADWYDKLVGESGSEYQREVVHPGVVRLLALKKGERAVDIACGQGVLCRLLTDRGIEMTGVDAAAELIRAARERGPEAIRYLMGDARDLKFLPADTFTAAACVLAIQNIHPIQPVFAGVQRILRPGGRFVLVMMHPCFRGPKESSWGWDEKTKEQYRRVDRYLLPRKTPIVTHPGKDPDTYTWSFHKPLEQYVRSLRNAGLLVDALEEWTSHKVSEPGPRAATENSARKEIPMFLALRGIKVGMVSGGDGQDDGLDQTIPESI